MPNIVLIGVPGAGKTTVGELIASHLGREFVDSDQVIESRVGKTIAEIFTVDGEAAFRKIEAQVIAELLAIPNQVVSLGGGALGNEQTRTAVNQHVVLWLETGLAQAVERVGMNRNRPLLLGNVRGQLSALLTAREPVYKAAATITVNTSELGIDEVTQAAMQELAKIGIVR